MSTPRFPSASHTSRNVIVWTSVALAHGAALWVLQGALGHTKLPEAIVPVVLLSEFIAPPVPVQAPLPPAPPVVRSPPVPAPPVVTPPKPATPKPAPAPKPRPVRTVPKPAPVPLPVVNAAPEAPAVPAPQTVPVERVQSAPVTVATTAAPAAPPTPPAPPAPPSPPRIELPSSNAAYLNNPTPAYPSISKRMGEQGKVLLRVLINVNGQPEQIELKQSSGYDRLDRQARETVQRWRFVPGKRNGAAEAMWYVVPINFVLD